MNTVSIIYCFLHIYESSSSSSSSSSPCFTITPQVSWSGKTNRIAAGFDKEGSARENGVVIFDLNTMSITGSSLTNGKPNTGGAFGESGVSVQWIGDTDQLAMGTTKWLRIWDVRTPPDSAMRIVAHQKTVKGIEVDPSRPHILCTWSEGHSEVNHPPLPNHYI
jgi:hypothetical protein